MIDQPCHPAFHAPRDQSERCIFRYHRVAGGIWPVSVSIRNGADTIILRCFLLLLFCYGTAGA